MILTKEGGVSEELSTKNEAVLASSKTYYFAGFRKDDGNKIYNCTMDGLQPKESGTDATQKTPLVCEPKAEAKNSTVKIIKNIDYPKMNFMSLVVNGLRVLFAKTVTFNMMMTLKALVF
ncbi:hypothetical protein JZ751_014081 [Albula glossodonta]|uniref:Uncharacterized protein n=1 Tax=Albula glossodonta TaxID=121402 RepID=A0A8T2NSD4_9TELE|nr:hypothetical protein JZ751_014081 [Albula glossodonta]